MLLTVKVPSPPMLIVPPPAPPSRGIREKKRGCGRGPPPSILTAPLTVPPALNSNLIPSIGESFTSMAWTANLMDGPPLDGPPPTNIPFTLPTVRPSLPIRLYDPGGTADISKLPSRATVAPPTLAFCIGESFCISVTMGVPTAPPAASVNLPRIRTTLVFRHVISMLPAVAPAASLMADAADGCAALGYHIRT